MPETLSTVKFQGIYLCVILLITYDLFQVKCTLHLHMIPKYILVWVNNFFTITILHALNRATYRDQFVWHLSVQLVTLTHAWVAVTLYCQIYCRQHVFLKHFSQVNIFCSWRLFNFYFVAQDSWVTFKFHWCFRKDRKMALIQMATVDEAVMALIVSDSFFFNYIPFINYTCISKELVSCSVINCMMYMYFWKLKFLIH